MLCPICNGLRQLTADCQVCAGPAADCGRTVDYFGPYAPYQPYEETNALTDETEKASECCMHVLYCPNCGNLSEVSIAEWDQPVQEAVNGKRASAAQSFI